MPNDIRNQAAFSRQYAAARPRSLQKLSPAEVWLESARLSVVYRSSTHFVSLSR